MRDLAFVALLAVLVLGAFLLWGVTRWVVHSQRKSVEGAQWKVFEYSRNGVTHVTLELVTPDAEVLDKREVGQVRDDIDEYDDTLLTLRAKAQQRQAYLR